MNVGGCGNCFWHLRIAKLPERGGVTDDQVMNAIELFAPKGPTYLAQGGSPDALNIIGKVLQANMLRLKLRLSTSRKVCE